MTESATPPSALSAGPISPAQATTNEIASMGRKLAIGAGIVACFLVIQTAFTTYVLPGIWNAAAERYASKEQVAGIEKRLDLMASKEQLAAVEKRLDGLATRESIAALSDMVKTMNDRLVYIERVKNESTK